MSPGYKEGDAGMWDAKIGINGEALSGGSREEVRQPKSTAMIDWPNKNSNAPTAQEMNFEGFGEKFQDGLRPG